MHLDAPDITVVVPAYNEEERLGETLDHLWTSLSEMFTSFEVIVVDDGSSDGTGKLVEDYAIDHEEVRLLEYGENRGKGYAVRRGVMDASGKVVLFSDADLSTPIGEVQKLLADMETCDIAIGSRAIRESRIVQYQPIYRVLMGKTFNKIVQLLAIPGIKDTQCGFKCFRRDDARNIFGRCRIDGFSFDVEVLFIARSLGLRIKEVGIVWENSPESKVHPVYDSLRMLRDLIKVRMNSIRGLYKGDREIGR